MLTIVFGAGASYDSCPSLQPGADDPNRPPLADELFDPRFNNELIDFEVLTTIVPFLRHRFDGETVEQVLERLRIEAGDDPTRASQLQATRFYLQSMIARVENRWLPNLRTSSNYSTLLETIRPLRNPSEPVCLVTFNYDRLLDWSLQAVYQPIHDLSSYLTGDYKLFKLHGSTNWARPVLNPPTVESHANAWAVIRALGDQALSTRLGDEFLVAEGRPLVRVEDQIVLPAIAVPLGAKVEYECPASHVSLLRELLPSTSTLVLIGWRALDPPFMVDLEQVSKSARVVCVSGHKESADEVGDRMTDKGFVDVSVEGDGFTNFVLRRRIAALLR